MAIGEMQSSFLQSREWEKLQHALGRKSWRVDGHLVIKHDFACGFNYLYSPRPAELSDKFLHQVRQIALKEKSLFFKIDPGGNTKNWKTNIIGRRFSHCIQPRKTVIIDLTKTEEELLGAMHTKTRYNIRLAERRGVSVARHAPPVAKNIVETFCELLRDTAKRDQFHLHPQDYYEKLIGVRGTHFENALFLAEYRGRAVAAALVNYYHQSATYLHGASSNFHRNIMAPHLLHWRIIQDAKKRRFLSYDLWGIDEKKWPGVSRFKLGFGGSVVEYPESIDIIFRPVWYRVYRAARRVL